MHMEKNQKHPANKEVTPAFIFGLEPLEIV
jgi:hypothetical protein